MKYFLSILFTLVLLGLNNPSYSQDDEGGKKTRVKREKKKGMGTQEDLDRQNKTSTKKTVYEKKIEKARKDKQKRNEVTRKKAERIAAKRLKRAQKNVNKGKKRARKK